MIWKRTISVVLYLLAFCFVGAIVFILSLALWTRHVQPDESFVKIPVVFNFYDWFDAGVVDVNADGLQQSFEVEVDQVTELSREVVE